MENTAIQLYLNLVKRCLMDYIYPHPLDKKRSDYDKHYARYHPTQAHTMVGLPRLNNVQACVESVLSDNIPGDLIEAGVWRGGVTILMQAILKAYGVTDRYVWVADSFEGLPPADLEKYPKDQSTIDFSKMKNMAVPIDEVKANFEAYQLLDDRVKFYPGFFESTMPDNPIPALAVLRLDGDMYSSTIECLKGLYPKLASGGYCIVDDYGTLRQATNAVDDYREQHGISEEIQWIETSATDYRWGIFWRKG